MSWEPSTCLKEWITLHKYLSNWAMFPPPSTHSQEEEEGEHGVWIRLRSPWSLLPSSHMGQVGLQLVGSWDRAPQSWGSGAVGCQHSGLCQHFQPRALNSQDMQRPGPGGSMGIRRGLGLRRHHSFAESSSSWSCVHREPPGPEMSHNTFPPLRGLLIGERWTPYWIMFNLKNFWIMKRS